MAEDLLFAAGAIVLAVLGAGIPFLLGWSAQRVFPRSSIPMIVVVALAVGLTALSFKFNIGMKAQVGPLPLSGYATTFVINLVALRIGVEHAWRTVGRNIGNSPTTSRTEV